MLRILFSTTAAFILALGLVACAKEEEVGSASPIPTVAPTPTPSPPPPLQAGAVAKWGGTQVTTVCLVENQVYPQEPDFRFPVTAWLRALLTPVGIAITENAGPCDATLEVSIRIVATPGDYEGPSGPVTIYTGGDKQVTVSLTAADREPIAFENSYSSPAWSVASSSDPATPHEYIVEESYRVAHSLIEATIDIWGMAPAIEALCLPDDPLHVFTGSSAEGALLDASGLRDVSSPVPHSYTSWRLWFETGEVVEDQGRDLRRGCR
jgi:hypothetical protein